MNSYLYLPDAYIVFVYNFPFSTQSISIRLHCRRWEYNQEILSSYLCYNPPVYHWLIAQIQAEFPEAHRRFLATGRLILFEAHLYRHSRPFATGASQ